LLRLLLPTNKKVQLISPSQSSSPSNSPFCSIGRSDGRCVQKAGT